MPSLYAKKKRLRAFSRETIVDLIMITDLVADFYTRCITTSGGMRIITVVGYRHISRTSSLKIGDPITSKHCGAGCKLFRCIIFE